jgi:hypothetical protein
MGTMIAIQGSAAAESVSRRCALFVSATRGSRSLRSLGRDDTQGSHEALPKVSIAIGDSDLINISLANFADSGRKSADVQACHIPIHAARKRET